jgi:hypothetical protein
VRPPRTIYALVISALILLVAAGAARASSTPPIFGAPTLLESLAPFAPGTTGLVDLSCGSPTVCVSVGGKVEERTTDAGTATPPDWSTPQVITQSSLEGVSCPNGTLCVAVADDGTAVRSTDGGVTWSKPVSVESGDRLLHVACAAGGTCLAASYSSSSGAGNLYVSTDQGQTWSGPYSDGSYLSVSSMTCPSDGVCAETGLGGTAVLVSTDVGGPNPPTWTATPLSNFLTGVSCTPNDICVAVDTTGHAFVSTNVDSPSASWPGQLIVGTGDPSTGLVGLVSVSCAETAENSATDTCVAGDSVGSTVISTDVGGADPATWSVVPTWDTGYLQSADGALLYPIACVTGGWCAVATTGGNVTYGVVPLANPGGTVWSTPPAAITGADQMSAVSCAPNGQVCATLDNTGHAVTSIDGGADWAPAVTVDHSDAGSGYGVSCLNSGQCVAVDTLITIVNGNVVIGSSQVLKSTPTATGATWSSNPIDLTDTRDGVGEGPAVDGLSCVDSGLCVAVDVAGRSVISTDLGDTWTVVPTGDTAPLTSVSCPTIALCVAVDNIGGAVVSTNAASDSPSWSTPATIDGAALTAVSCTPQGLCVASDKAGRVVTTINGGEFWSKPAVIDGAAGLVDVSCTAAQLCVAVDALGNAFYSTNPGASSPTWTLSDSNTSDLTAVSCVAIGLCLGVDGGGDAIVGISQVGKADISGVTGAFPDTLLGTSSAPQTLTVTNTGGAPLNVASASLVGSDAGEFSLAQNSCEGAALAPGAACSVEVSFSPAHTGAFSAADLAVTSDSASSPDEVALTGTGVLGPIISLSGDPVVFPATVVGKVSRLETLTASNTGGTPLHFSTVALSGAGAGQFKLVRAGCRGAVVAPGASCSVDVEFSPTSRGAHSASLVLASDVEASPTVVAVTGAGLTTAAAPNLFSFVSVKSGGRGKITVKLDLERAGRFALTTSSTLPKGKARKPRKARARRITYSAHLAATIHGPTTATIRITPSKAAAAALKAQRKLRVVVSVKYTPTGLPARTKSSVVTVRVG